MRVSYEKCVIELSTRYDAKTWTDTERRRKSREPMYITLANGGAAVHRGIIQRAAHRGRASIDITLVVDRIDLFSSADTN